MTMYPGTRRQGKSPRVAKARVTAGLRWAPDTAPMNRMTAITIRPGAATAAVLVIIPWLVAFTTPAPAPTRTRKKVPSSSEKSRLHSSPGSSKSVAGRSSASKALRHPGVPPCADVRMEAGCQAAFDLASRPGGGARQIVTARCSGGGVEAPAGRAVRLRHREADRPVDREAVQMPRRRSRARRVERGREGIAHHLRRPAALAIPCRHPLQRRQVGDPGGIALEDEVHVRQPERDGARGVRRQVARLAGAGPAREVEVPVEPQGADPGGVGPAVRAARTQEARGVGLRRGGRQLVARPAPRQQRGSIAMIEVDGVDGLSNGHLGTSGYVLAPPTTGSGLYESRRTDRRGIDTRRPDRAGRGRAPARPEDISPSSRPAAGWRR